MRIRIVYQPTSIVWPSAYREMNDEHFRYRWLRVGSTGYIIGLRTKQTKEGP